MAPGRFLGRTLGWVEIPDTEMGHRWFWEHKFQEVKFLHLPGWWGDEEGDRE